jgi:hypothetical protein
MSRSKGHVLVSRAEVGSTASPMNWPTTEVMCLALTATRPQRHVRAFSVQDCDA